MLTSPPVNLTLDSEIVKPIRGVNPISGWNLVVFERVGDGHSFHSVVRDGQPWSAGLSGIMRQASFVAYAVRSDHDLRHELSREVSTWNRAGTFTLHCTLTLEVEAPRVVVEQLPQDPLGLLEKMAGDLYHNAASCVDWVTVEQEGPGFWNRILDSESRTGGGGTVPNRRRVEEFAASRGFKLHNVELRAVFSEDFGEWIRRERKERMQRRVNELEVETERLKVQQTRSLEEERAKLQRFQRVQETLCGLITSSGEDLESSLTHIADRVTTPADLQRIVVQLLDVYGNVSQLVAAGEPAQNESIAGSALRQRVLALLPDASSTLHPATRQIGRVATLAAELSCSAREKDQLLSAALHLVGDLVLDDAADSQALEQHRNQLREVFDAIQPTLETQRQHEVLASLLELHSLEEDGRL
jgi:hypothetical protein